MQGLAKGRHSESTHAADKQSTAGGEGTSMDRACPEEPWRARCAFQFLPELSPASSFHPFKFAPFSNSKK